MSKAKYPYAIQVGDVTVRTPPLGVLQQWVVDKLGSDKGQAKAIAKGIGIGIAYDIAAQANQDAAHRPISQASVVEK